MVGLHSVVFHGLSKIELLTQHNIESTELSAGPFLLALFPGSHALEREHWSCAGVESLVFFVTWKALKVERRWRGLNCAWAYPRLRTGKRAKVAGNLLHISSYQALNNIHTKRWSIVGWTMCKTLPFCFGPILITSCLCKKKYQALRVIHIRVLEEPGNEATFLHERVGSGNKWVIWVSSFQGTAQLSIACSTEK